MDVCEDIGKIAIVFFYHFIQLLTQVVGMYKKSFRACISRSSRWLVGFMAYYCFGQAPDTTHKAIDSLKTTITTQVATAPAPAPAPAPAAKIDSGDTAWMIVATALVMLMTLPGLALFYGGLAKRKDMLNVIAMSFVTF